MKEKKEEKENEGEDGWMAVFHMLLVWTTCHQSHFQWVEVINIKASVQAAT